MENVKSTGYSESQLLNEVRAGSKRAFEKLYCQHSSAIYVHLRRLIRDEDVAKEILQDVFLKIWDRKAELNVSQPIRPYLFRMARNMLIDFVRRNKREQRLLDYLQMKDVDPGIQPLEKLICKEEEMLFHKAVQMLPPQRRKIFTLCKLEGNSYEEVSRLLGISSSTVSDHIVKATKSIRSLIICAWPFTCILFIPMVYGSIYQFVDLMV